MLGVEELSNLVPRLALSISSFYIRTLLLVAESEHFARLMKVAVRLVGDAQEMLDLHVRCTCAPLFKMLVFEAALNQTLPPVDLLISYSTRSSKPVLTHICLLFCP